MPSERERSMVTLEVTLNPDERYLYRVQLTDAQTGRTVGANFNLIFEELERLFAGEDPEAYGEYLYNQMFRQSVGDKGEKGEVELRLHEMMRRVQDAGRDELRLNLGIGIKLSKLHALAWEYLFDSKRELALAADLPLVLFRDVSVDAPRGEAITGQPRVLVAVVSPSENDLNLLNQQHQLDLAPIPMEPEIERLKGLFEMLRPALLYNILPSATESDQSTRDQITKAMKDGPFHVLHLSCHGVILNKRAWLVLTKADGRVDLVAEDDFAKLFARNVHVRLVLLDACQSARQSQTGAFSGIVPKLMEQVPAAIGMQRTWFTGVADDRFTRNFYEELCRHGYVDRALQRARQDLRCWRPERWEWGTAALYLRLGEEGQLFQPMTEPAGAAEPTRPQAELTRPPRHGGTGLRIGPGSVIKGKIEGRFAGGNIVDVEGGEIPKELASAQPGIGLDIEGATLEEGVLRGEFAGGGIYRQRLAAQARERFGKKEQEQAIRNQIAYYRRRLTELHSDMDRMSGVKKKRLQTELSDIQDEIDELQQSLHGF